MTQAEPVIPAGRIAFYLDPHTHELHYSVVRVRGRYADHFDVIELPRGEPDDLYVHSDLAPSDAQHRVVVERSKEGKTLDRLGITYHGDPLAALEASGYRYEKTESLAEAAKRELMEEHGFNEETHPHMVRRHYTMRPFPVASSYGASEEYRDFVHIGGDIGDIPLQRTDKIETKAPQRKGVAYVEEGSWATLKDIRANAEAFLALAESDQTSDQQRLLEEAHYQKSIADWMEKAEAALVGLLRKSGIQATTSSTVSPALAIHQTGASEYTSQHHTR